MFAVGYADAILTARSFAGRHRQHVDADQELVAMGGANLAAGVTQGFPVGGSGSRTAVSDQIGGRTQLVGVFAAVVVAVVLLLLTAPVGKLPTACLGAVIVAAAIGLIRPADWRNLAHAGRSQVVIAAVTCVGVLTIGVLRALIVAVALSIVDTVSRRAKPNDAVLGWVSRLDRYADVSLHPSAQVIPGIVIYRLDGGIFFADASYFKARVHEAIAGAKTPTHHLVLEAEGINEIDASGGQALRNLVRSLRTEGITLVIARLKDPLRSQFDEMGLSEAIGGDNFFPTTHAAVMACKERPTES
jgi:MFS superfamily sulfate permease-like transporter